MFRRVMWSIRHEHNKIENPISYCSGSNALSQTRRTLLASQLTLNQSLIVLFRMKKFAKVPYERLKCKTNQYDCIANAKYVI